MAHSLSVRHTSTADTLRAPPDALPKCEDQGPWPCEEAGCPSANVSCALLAVEGACSLRFGEIWNRMPAGISEFQLVQASCPAACSTVSTWRSTVCRSSENEEHRVGACVAEAGRPMPNVTARLIHGWASWITLRGAHGAAPFDAEALCQGQCANSTGTNHALCLNNCAHGVGHGLFWRALEGSVRFTCTRAKDFSREAKKIKEGKINHPTPAA